MLPKGTAPAQAYFVGIRGEPVAEGEQEAAELLTLVVVERGEERVFGFFLRARGAGELLLAGRGEGDQVAAAVVGVALAADESVGCERVEQCDGMLGAMSMASYRERSQHASRADADTLTLGELE